MARIKPQALLNQSKKKKGPSRISISTIVVCNLVVAVVVLSLVTTYCHWSQRFCLFLSFFPSLFRNFYLSTFNRILVYLSGQETHLKPRVIVLRYCFWDVLFSALCFDSSVLFQRTDVNQSHVFKTFEFITPYKYYKFYKPV